ncbi:MAG TPA: circularly permuted type 2 ATP-grasp protein, partial [Verrucomicrobiales bacterium]|nr:circularly permuted type 2 ATP-grasp protein [Verrucomicrobiales bacterium]
MIPPDIYHSELGIRDESIHADGSVVEAWSEVFESYERHGSGVLKKWSEVALRISRDRGLAYKPDRGEGPHWTLDPIPWVFGPDEWDQIEKGISQKLRLSAAILADLYGNQRLLDQKFIPASIVLSHRGFLRALHDLPLSGTSARLGMSGFDIARGPGGLTYILNDRFDCPYGLGVALENRTVVNRVLPNLFRRCLVRKIGHFFQEWFEYLGSLAPRAAEQSRIVILDSSNIEENSEISFLANYCGITRVVPSD